MRAAAAATIGPFLVCIGTRTPRSYGAPTPPTAPIASPGGISLRRAPSPGQRTPEDIGSPEIVRRLCDRRTVQESGMRERRLLARRLALAGIVVPASLLVLTATV